MKKENIMLNMDKEGIIAVIRTEDSEKALKMTEACLKGGISSIEITTTVPRAHRVIERLSEEFSGSGAVMLAGVGIGLWRDLCEATRALASVSESYQPNHENAAVYDRNFNCYKQLYRALKSIR